MKKYFYTDSMQEICKVHKEHQMKLKNGLKLVLLFPL
ncbi:hypothetical protein EDF67_10446 [Sphingobacterium sp. JUb78]|nr:hypothetical protein [Sphingobacterium kitahiroshimense]TCR10955.1 hypothetical protein EDF67_10446 [Sphingobacterium sp. JUb78]